jgi:hypothetical protein
MTAGWNEAQTEWVCALGDAHQAYDKFCRDQLPWEPSPERAADTPPGSVSSTSISAAGGPGSAPEATLARSATPGFFVTLPNFVRVRLEGTTTIGRGAGSLIGLALLQYADVSRAHLEVHVQGQGMGSYLEFDPVKRSEDAPVYYYDMPTGDVLTADALERVVPSLVRKGDSRRDDFALFPGDESRLFCLGQSCFIKFDWEAE